MVGDIETTVKHPEI